MQQMNQCSKLVAVTALAVKVTVVVHVRTCQHTHGSVRGVIGVLLCALSTVTKIAAHL